MSSQPPSPLDDLRRALDDFAEIDAELSCGSSSCVHRKGGMVTNGPCRCYHHDHPLRKYIYAAARLASAAKRATMPIRDRGPGAGPATRRRPPYEGLTPVQADRHGHAMLETVRALRLGGIEDDDLVIGLITEPYAIAMTEVERLSAMVIAVRAAVAPPEKKRK